MVDVQTLTSQIRQAHRDPEHGVEGLLGIGVSVPATSANLGPGYDAFGVALDIPLIAVSAPREDRRIVPFGLGADELPTSDDNLVWRALVAWCERAGEAVPDVSIHVHSAIPLERGLGSSSAAAVAGLALGRALVGGSGGTQQMLAMATELEGHPDNAAPALVGGLVVCTGSSFRRVTPDSGLRPVLVVPEARQSTNAARSALPESVPLAVAAANAARAAATFSALAGLTPLTADLMVDELHEPARMALMAGSGAVVAGLRAAGIPSALSGAGPAVLAILDVGDEASLRTVHEVCEGVDAAMEVVETAWNLAGVETCPPGRAG